MQKRAAGACCTIDDFFRQDLKVLAVVGVLITQDADRPQPAMTDTNDLARGGYLAARLTVSMTSSDFVRHRSCLTTIIAAFGKPHQPSREHPAKTAATEPNRILSPSFSSTSVTGRPLTRVPFVECKSCSR